MILKILSIIGALLILVIFLYLIRKTLLFLLGMVLLFAGSAGVVVGGLLIFVKCFYFYGPGVIFLSVIFVLFGKEMIGKANTVKIPDHASEDGSNMDQTEGRIVAGRNLYDRHYGSSFGSGF